MYSEDEVLYGWAIEWFRHQKGQSDTLKPYQKGLII